MHHEVGDVADTLRLPAHLHDAARVVRDGPEHVHGQHVRLLTAALRVRVTLTLNCHA